MNSIRLARNAMATRFEILLQGDNITALRSAGEEALDEIERLDQQLNLYNPSSELSRVNREASQHPVRVEPGLFRLLKQAKSLSEVTQGTFDISVAPLMRCWGFMSGNGEMPNAKTVQEARDCIGMRHVLLDEDQRTVRFEKQGMMLDLGAIGKGYAVEQAARILREAGMEHVLLHGGTSTVYAIGNPLDAPAWNVAIAKPVMARNLNRSSAHLAAETGIDKEDILTVTPLNDESLSVSAVWGKGFEVNGQFMGHVIDPRTGYPSSDAVMAAVALPSPTESDAISTALLVLGKSGIVSIPRLRPGMRWLVAGGGAEKSWLEGNIINPLRGVT